MTCPGKMQLVICGTSPRYWQYFDHTCADCWHAFRGGYAFFDGRDGRCLTPISATWHEIIIQSKTVCCCTLNSGAYSADDERSFRESEARVCPAPAWGIWKRPLRLLFDADLRKRAQHRPRLPSPARYGQTWTVQAVLAPALIACNGFVGTRHAASLPAWARPACLPGREECKCLSLLE